MLLNNDITLVRVSSVLNKDVKQYGKNHMFDGEEDTCWNSDHGTPQWINLFVNPQDLSMIKICVQFQGGFCGKNCFAEFYEDNTVVANFPFYPEDVAFTTICIIMQVFKFVWISCVFNLISDTICDERSEVECSKLQVGQYLCDKPVIDTQTQEISGCTKDGISFIQCYPFNGIVCDRKTFNGSTVGFQREIPCRYTNGYSYTVAVGLSMFLGWLGVDRYYLGYPAIAIVKFCTFGFFGIGALFDFLLISLQVVLPADASNYVIDMYGPRLIGLFIDNETYFKPQSD